MFLLYMEYYRLIIFRLYFLMLSHDLRVVSSFLRDCLHSEIGRNLDVDSFYPKPCNMSCFIEYREYFLGPFFIITYSVGIRESGITIKMNLCIRFSVCIDSWSSLQIRRRAFKWHRLLSLQSKHIRKIPKAVYSLRFCCFQYGKKNIWTPNLALNL